MLCLWPLTCTLLLALAGCKSCASSVAAGGGEPLGIPAGGFPTTNLQLHLTEACPSSDHSSSSQL